MIHRPLDHNKDLMVYLTLMGFDNWETESNLTHTF